LKVNRFLAGTLAIVLIAGLGTPAFAENETGPIADGDIVTPDNLLTPAVADPEDVVFQNGDDATGVGGLFIDNFLPMNDFELEESAIITDFHFVVQCNFLPCNIESAPFDYIVLDDDGMMPGDVIASGIAINVETEALGDGFFGPRFAVWFDLEEPVPLDADTRHWFGLHTGDDFTSDPGKPFWEQSTNDFGGCSWDAFEGDLPAQFEECTNGPGQWFQLTSKIDVVGGEFLPIDSTALMLAGAQTFSWMIPVVLSGIGIGLFIVSRKSE